MVAGPAMAQDAKAPLKARDPVPASQPAPPRIKGLKDPLGVTDLALIQATLRDLPDSVVVVEAEGFSLLPTQQVRLDMFRLLDGSLAPGSGLPLAPWADGPALVSGGNRIAQVFPLGWGYR